MGPQTQSLVPPGGFWPPFGDTAVVPSPSWWPLASVGDTWCPSPPSLIPFDGPCLSLGTLGPPGVPQCHPLSPPMALGVSWGHLGLSLSLLVSLGLSLGAWGHPGVSLSPSGSLGGFGAVVGTVGVPKPCPLSLLGMWGVPSPFGDNEAGPGGHWVVPYLLGDIGAAPWGHQVVPYLLGDTWAGSWGHGEVPLSLGTLVWLLGTGVSPWGH